MQMRDIKSNLILHNCSLGHWMNQINVQAQMKFVAGQSELRHRKFLHGRQHTIHLAHNLRPIQRKRGAPIVAGSGGTCLWKASVTNRGPWAEPTIPKVTKAALLLIGDALPHLHNCHVADKSSGVAPGPPTNLPQSPSALEISKALTPLVGAADSHEDAALGRHVEISDMPS